MFLFRVDPGLLADHIKSIKWNASYYENVYIFLIKFNKRLKMISVNDLEDRS